MDTEDADFETRIRIKFLVRTWATFMDECRRLPSETFEVNEFVRALAAEVEMLARELRVRSPFLKTAAYRTGLLDV